MRIAISYRRADSIAITGRIFDRLVAHYGRPAIFMDIADIPYGTDVRERIDHTLRQTDILIVVVGREWMGAISGAGARLLDEKDPVRVEVQTALANKIRLIPVLVNDAKMPDASELPDDLK